MAKIFLSYRRSDSPAMCDRIYARLVEHFGKDAVFKDIDSIPLGADFAQYIEQCIAQCAVMLVIIGPKWLYIANADGVQRLDDPQDFVRMEIETALRSGIHVIPIAVDGAGIPIPEHLPPSLRPLVRHNSWEVHHDPYFDTDMQRILKALEQWAPPLVPGGTQAAPDAIACPRCRQVDQVRKVSAVANDGTPLARRVAAPPDPATTIPRPEQRGIQPHAPRGLIQAPGGPGFTVTLTIIMTFLACAGLMAVLTINVPSNQGQLFQSQAQTFLVNVAIILLIISLLVVMIVAWAISARRYGAKVRRRYTQAQAEWQAAVDAKTPAWQRALGRWQKAYYCARCDSVFIPGERDSLTPADQMNTLLSRQ